MSRNDEGEFELVLGNRQLLSGFFIVVILFGVFFTMGYIVGRHSSPAPLTTASASPAPDSPPAPAPSPQVSPAAPPPGQAEVMPAEPAKPAAEPVTTTQPATAPPEAPHAPEPKPVAQPAAATGGVAEPAPGSYLQVAAPRRTAAGGVVESLKNKGITAVLAPGPNEDTVRVLVGPLDASALGKMRADLESAGFKPFAKRY
jgi:DedD protein